MGAGANQLRAWRCCSHRYGRWRIVTHLKHKRVHLLPYVVVGQQIVLLVALQQHVEKGESSLPLTVLRHSILSLRAELLALFPAFPYHLQNGSVVICII